MEWGIFNDESADYTQEEAVEAGFPDKGEAEAALVERYSSEDGCYAHLVEEPDEDEDLDEDDPEDDDAHAG